ncbi:hypothetical protein CSC2_30420 [Clostridium zeae]|uniref:Prepilin-type N-terminal cleavage/methylation domain-containing protein n=1 Tax=Clostridium zeae TaxID=2759022 RepID=A0ABQ1ECP6_9CLOT|nr:prepilin-type N-terminal cleavage/methylation domain-containing protein [Clostridium zeae]GFZ32516.1 hypothetical protein CSC2_30420 [Clostridium zeae]
MSNVLNTRLNKKKKGFTLIELIIVIAIIAIIAAIAIPNFAKVRNDSKYKADVQSCETIKRTVLTKIADGSITVDPAQTTTKVITITFPSGTLTFSDSSLSDTLSTVKKPQEDGATGYTIWVSKTGEVEVLTTSGTAKTDTITTP